MMSHVSDPVSKCIEGNGQRIDSVLIVISSVLIRPADAAAADSGEAPPAGELLPDVIGVVPAGLDVSRVSAVGSESGRCLAHTR